MNAIYALFRIPPKPWLIGLTSGHLWDALNSWLCSVRNCCPGSLPGMLLLWIGKATENAVAVPSRVHLHGLAISFEVQFSILILMDFVFHRMNINVQKYNVSKLMFHKWNSIMMHHWRRCEQFLALWERCSKALGKPPATKPCPVIPGPIASYSYANPTAILSSHYCYC